MELRTLKAYFAAEFIDLREAAQIEDARWEAFQIEYLNNAGRFGADSKSRQVGWSWTSALDAYSDSRTNGGGQPYIFVSLNLTEAKEKIRYLRRIIDATDEQVRPKRFIVDTSTEIEFEDGTRFISHPLRPVRGKPQARIYLDEIAHYPEGMDRKVYTAALPSTTKGDGYIRLGSSPLGARGLFWEIMTESLRKWPGFRRMIIPWWIVSALCTDIETASVEAPLMETAARVHRFGTPALVEIFENMFLEDFQQEYECLWVDEATAWISWDVITRNRDADLIYWHAKSIDQALEMLDEVEHGIATSQVEPVLTGGIDVGRHRDLTELIVCGKSTTGQLPIRFMVSLERTSFDDQKEIFTKIIERLPFTSVLVDRNGIGMQLAEDLERTTGGRAAGVTFSGPSKELWAVEARVQAERNKTPLPPDRDLAYQIHSIKKTPTQATANRYDAERNDKHHADKFWAWALALWAARTETAGGFGARY